MAHSRPTFAPFSDPLTRRIFVYLALPVVFIGVVFNLVYLHQEKASNTDVFVKNTRAAVDLFARSLRIAVFSSDLEMIEVLANSLLEHDDFLSVAVFDKDHGSLVQAQKAGFSPSLDEPVQATLPPDLRAKLRHGDVIVVEGRTRIDFWATVRTGRAYDREEDLYLEPETLPPTGGVVGFIRLTTTTAGIRAAANENVRRNAVLTLLFLFVGGVVAYVVVSQVNRPLRDLLAHVHAHESTGANESISHLSDRFHALVDELDGAFSTIRHLNESLERRVEERTRELAHANASLHAEVRQRRSAQVSIQEAHDQLEEKVLERTVELEHTHAQLRHAEKLTALGQLAASLAHEFNNPICGVRNCIEELRHGLPSGGEEAEIAELAIKECERMAALTRSLRQFSRPSSDGVGSVAVEPCLSEMIRLIRNEFDRSGVRMVLGVQSQLPPVRANEGQLKQVFLNLLQNAHDAMDGGRGTVTIGASEENGQVAISIRDEGCGISEDHLPRIFEPFFSTKSAVKGTGLGLSVSYGIVDRFGGRLEVESTPGQGSTFTIRLPIGKEVDT